MRFLTEKESEYSPFEGDDNSNMLDPKMNSKPNAKVDVSAKRLILYYGGVKWGLPMGILFSITYILYKDGPHFSSFLSSWFLLSLALSIPIFFLMGCVWGWLMYRFLESQMSSS